MTKSPESNDASRPIIDLLVLDLLADWEIGLVTAQLNGFPGQMLPSPYRVRTVGLTPAPVRTMGGLSVTPDTTLDRVRPSECSLFILPGAPSWDAEGHPEATEHAVQVLAQGTPVAAICGATAGLARAGVLDDRAHTSNAAIYLEATGYAGAHGYREAPVVVDRGLITAGSTFALPFAVAIMRTLQLHPPQVLDAWSALFETGDPRHYASLMAARAAAGVG